ncbi:MULTISPECIES: M14 family zinc carboxypeptidase [unclassified Nocardioides]|uniref:M14 family zinc carboxypeptidase n=1 Tax=unclassified Nocardioides TaxID=2615069 RepID=UPI0009F07B69|nr:MULTISPECIES: M14 family zinc carboxypeptidase [unclassified Nocardioides]GAW52439.1 peptidase M14, carboxypeptidase A [Nocardioides sp. PD653-B2]GAW55618.1 peptidase M14, carboxypeptidase A [Nocardioides sp. PD653]
MRLGILLTTLALAVAPLASVASPAGAQRAPVGQGAVIEKVVIGHSVRGRPITAWHLGERTKPKVLLVATMHGNEGAPRQILAALRDGKPVHGINLWVLPVYNPDGLAAGTRKNAHGVDLNRNFPYHWADLDGSYESGPHASSEPETRAMMRFLKKIRPDRIVSFHQPLHGVDTDTKSQKFSRKVADKLNLPRKSFTCGGVCHGTMTGWFNSRFKGTALTAEYGAHPGPRLMRKVAPRQVLSIWGARRR